MAAGRQRRSRGLSRRTRRHSVGHRWSFEGCAERGRCCRRRNTITCLTSGEQNLSNLSSEWIKTTFDAVIARISNGISARQNKDGIGIPVSRIETIWNQRVDFARIGYVAAMDSQEGVKWRLVEGDVLFSHINSDKHLGKVAVYHESEGALYHGVNLLRLELYKDVCDPQYFWYYCNAARTVGLFEAIAQHAVNQSSINQRRLREVPFVLPPLKEQRRIAAKLDALSGRTSRV